MTAQQWVFSLVIKEGQKLYRIDRSHPDCVLKKKEKKNPTKKEAVSTNSDWRRHKAELEQRFSSSGDEIQTGGN